MTGAGQVIMYSRSMETVSMKRLAVFVYVITACMVPASAQGRSEVTAPVQPKVLDNRVLSIDEQLSPWFADCQRRMQRTWQEAKNTPNLGNRRCTCILTVNATGRISALKIVKKSGLKSLNKSVLAAIKEAAPFRHRSDAANKPLLIDFEISKDICVFRMRVAA